MSKPATSSATSSSPSPSTFPKGGLVLILMVAAFVGFLVLRIRGATAKRDEIARLTTETAKRTADVAGRPPVVETLHGTPDAWQAVVSFEGSVTPVQEADLAFKVGGRLSSVKVKVGDRVRPGQVLAVLDANEARAQLNVADAQVAASAAQLGLATDAAKRTAAVVAEGAGPEAQGVQADKQRELAEAQSAASRAQRDLARAAIQNHTLTAAFAGTVSKVPAGAGGVVAPGVPQFHVVDLRSLKLVGTVAEADAKLVRVGASVTLPGGRKASGKVKAVVAVLDPATKRVPVEVLVDNDDAQPLLAGALVQGAIQGGQSVPVIRLPHDVLKPGAQDQVFVVGADGRLQERRVTFVIATNGDLLVREGLAIADEIVAKPWPEAKNGDVVSVAGATPIQAAPGNAAGSRP